MDPSEYKKQTLKTYDSNPDYFAQRFDGFSHYHTKTLDKFLSMLPGQAKILDLGSGAGTFAAVMKDRGFDVTCLDNSEQMAKISRSRGLKTIVMDLEYLMLQRNQFDAVWAMTSLIHIPKSHMEYALYGIGNVMKQDSLLYVGMGDGKDDGLIDEKALPGFSRHMSTFSEGEFDEVLARVFRIQEAWRTEGAANRTFWNYLARK